MSEQSSIFVINEVVAARGKGKAFLEAYTDRYVLGAEARGMKLVHRLVEPAMWLPEGTNRLVFIWTMAGPWVVWGAKQRARLDRDVDRWWQEDASALIETRQRFTLAEADALADLDNV